MRHTSAIERRPRPADAPSRGAGPAAGQRLFSRARAGRYHGGLWFKVFCERGPC